jgi:hypothetical protein
MSGLIDLSKIGVLAELERCQVTFAYSGEDTVKCLCPFHSDTNPSCTVNVNTRTYKCFTAGCGSTGDIVTFLAQVLKVDRTTMLVDLARRYSLSSEPAAKIINPNVIETYHKNIWSAFPLLKALRDRGVSDERIRYYRIGESNGRITIPIKNDNGLFVNIKFYLPGAPGNKKMQNLRGHGEIRLWPLEQLKFPTVVLCGGEVKAIVAADELNTHNIGAITATGGEGNWHNDFTPKFTGKTVYVCFDIDTEGQAAAVKRCGQLQQVAEWLGNVILPLDKDRYPHGDINDLIGQEHLPLKPILDACEQWIPPKLQHSGLIDDNEKVNQVSLHQASHAKFAGKRVRVKGLVSALDNSPFSIPKSLNVICAKGQPICAMCPVNTTDAGQVFNISHEHPALLEMVDSPNMAQAGALKRAIGIPESCRICTFAPIEFYNIEDARISPQLEVSNRDTERVMTPALCIGNGIELNETYSLVGRMHPHPKTQQATLLISKYRPTKDALGTYQCNNLERLSIFQPDDWTPEAIQKRLDTIYADFEANITRIYLRRDIHLIVDLAYHSPLLLNFDGKRVKGWIEALIMGDTAQGKTETTMNMLAHYGLGEKVECKNASVAGLLGGLQQMGTRWFVSWGVIPTHDRRLVVLEELKGASTEVIAKLTDMRSSGTAEIPKIEKRKTHARTRLIALSNSRSGHAISTYNFGIDAVRELIGSLEDIRRFDIVGIVGANDLDPNIINRLQIDRPKIEHTYTDELCRQLILWGWTRTANEIKFDDDATKLIMEESTKLCEEFTDAIPIIDRGSTRHKLARLTAAIATRTFSTGENLERIRIRVCHVQFIVALLRQLYGSATFGYGDYTASIQLTQELRDIPAIRAELYKFAYPKEFAKMQLGHTSADRTDFCDWLSTDTEAATNLLSFLVRHHALVRDEMGYKYRKTPPYIKFLKSLIADETTPNCQNGRPAHIPITNNGSGDF